MDIFEDLKELIGCEHISDMTGRDNQAAKKVVKGMDLKQYLLSQETGNIWHHKSRCSKYIKHTLQTKRSRENRKVY